MKGKQGILVILLCTISSCGGGTGGESTIPAITKLKVTVKDNPLSDQPYAGAYVVLHGKDNKSVEKTIQTGADGIADFGDIGRPRGTITLAHERSVEIPSIDTFVNVLVGDVVLYVGEGDQTTNPVGTIKVGVTDIPGGTSSIELWPFFADLKTHNPADVAVYSDEIQTDGKISLLANARNGTDVAGGKYGFLLD